MFIFCRSDEQPANETRIRITVNGEEPYEYRLTGLRKYTQYSVVVKAFNSKGDGPGSDPMIAQTLEDGEYNFFLVIEKRFPLLPFHLYL